MQVVAYPYVKETFERALEEVLSQYFSSEGTVQTISQEQIHFYHCELGFFIEKIEEPSSLPRITFTGSRSSEIQKYKCVDPKGVMPFAYTRRDSVTRTVYVSCSKTLLIKKPPYSNPIVTEPGSQRVIDRIWGQLFAVTESQQRAFCDRGIIYPSLDVLPTQASHVDYFMAAGTFRCFVDYGYTRGNTP